MSAACAGDRGGGAPVRLGRRAAQGQGAGIAAHYSFVTYVAVVIEVEVKDDGALLVHKATIAADCGPQINPERIRSQLEGACVMGLAWRRWARSASGWQGPAGQFPPVRAGAHAAGAKAVSVHLLEPDGDLPLGGSASPACRR